MQKCVLLTGAAGFIGSHVAESYLARGWRVVGADNLSSGKRENMAGFAAHENFTFCEGDICDRAFVNNIISQYRPHVINHHAAQKSVPASVEDPHFDAQINVLGLLNLLMAHEKHPFEHFIFVSSGGALASEPTDTAIPDETWQPQLLSPYAITKFAGENYVAAYAQLYGFAHTSLRYANIYGPRQIPAGECGVIPIFVENALAGRESVLFAYPDMPDGCTRDYVHVSDVARVNLLASDRPANCAVNISAGVELPIAHIYKKLMTALGKDLPLIKKGPRAGDVRRSVICNKRAGEIWGWQPEVGLEEGLRLSGEGR